MSDPFLEPGADPEEEEKALQSAAAAEAESQHEAEEAPAASQEQPGEEAEQEQQAAKEQQQAEQDQQQEVPKVPIHALHEARQENRELKQQLQTIKEQVDAWRKQQQSQQEQEQWDTDPLGMIRNEIGELKHQQEQAQQTAQEREQQQRQQEQFQQTVARQVNEFQQQAPDYPDALQHLLQQRAQELRLYGADEATIEKQLDGESQQLAYNALQQGRNPAQVAYELAKMRGYTPKQAQAAADAAAAEQGGGEAKGGGSQADQRLDQIERGQQASKTLSGAGGGESGEGGSPSLSDISRMTDEEFDKFWDDFARNAQ